MMAGYKFGKRESDALFDLMKTLELSNVDKSVTYLKVIKAAHKEILELRETLEVCKQLRERTEPSEFDVWREKKFGQLGRHIFDI